MGSSATLLGWGAWEGLEIRPRQRTTWASSSGPLTAPQKAGRCSQPPLWRCQGLGARPAARGLPRNLEGPGPERGRGFPPHAWTGSKWQRRKRALASAGTRQHIFRFWATLCVCICKHKGRIYSLSVDACWNKEWVWESTNGSRALLLRQD